jgi:hypothetical protein
MDTPMTPSSTISGSVAVPRRAAATVPMSTPKTIQSTAAPMTSDRVIGTAWTICGMTRSPRLT